MADAVRKPLRILWANLITVASAAILIGAMVVGLGIATGWAIAGMLGLGDTGTTVIEVLFVGLAAVVIVAFWRLATSIEPVVER
jgi:hypothetical protein